MYKELIDQYKNKLLSNNIKTYRNIFYILKQELQNNNLVLIGLRQLGKTILAEQLVKDFLNTKHEKKSINQLKIEINLPSDDNFLYLNLKSFTDISSEEIQEYINQNSFLIVFIDEIQVIKNWSNLVQVLVDMNKNTRFIFTGSNASALNKETAFGRVRIFNIFPLSYNEYQIIWDDKNFMTYIYYGSYPRNLEYKIPMIQYREMIEYLIIDKIAAEDNEGISVLKFNNFIKGIANYIGNEINYLKLSKAISVSRPTITNYIKLLQSASLIKTISKYKDNTEQKKYKVYFTDKSILPFFRNGNMSKSEWGSLIENTVFMYLISKYCYAYGIEKIQYYRNTEGKEIDFVIPTEKMIIEVKYWKTEKINILELTRNLNEVIKNDKFDNYKKIIITENLKTEKNGWEFIPLEEYLSEDK